MIDTKTSFEQHSKINRFDPDSKFLLIGNAIDGRVSFDHEVFENFEALRRKLPNIIAELKYQGEWDVALYQVPDDFRFRKIWGYYRKPNRGICIFNYSYMAAQERMVVKVTENEILFNGISVFNGIEKGSKLLEGFQVFESIYSVQLKRRDQVLSTES